MTVISNVTCPVCGSLCDDLEIEVENNVVTKVKNACGMGESKFLGYSGHRPLKPLIRRNGELVEVSMKEAIQKSAEILAQAFYPILYGWSNTSCEATRVGVELAEELGGVIDNTSTVCHGPSVLSIQDVGFSTSTLGQVRHRADLVLYWGSNPWSAHPRHIERYTNFTEGRFRHSEWHKYLSGLSAYRSKKRVERACRLAEEIHEAAAETSVAKERPRQLPSSLLEKERKMRRLETRITPCFIYDLSLRLSAKAYIKR